MAFYVAICLLAALAVVREDGGEHHVDLIRLIWGTTVGLALAHWFAFRLAGQLVGQHRHPDHEAALAAAQLAGAAVVAIMATAAVIIFPSSAEMAAIRIELAGFLGAAGYLIARGSGTDRGRSLRYALAMMGLAALVVVAKSRLGHH